MKGSIQMALYLESEPRPEKLSTDLRRPCGPSPGSPPALLAHEWSDALAPLLVASPGSEPPGSPNLSPRVFGRDLDAEDSVHHVRCPRLSGRKLGRNTSFFYKRRAIGHL